MSTNVATTDKSNKMAAMQVYLAALTGQTRRLLSAIVLINSNWKVPSDEVSVLGCAVGVRQTLPLHQVLSVASTTR